MNLAQKLINEWIHEKLVAGETLSGSEIASLKYKQHVIIHGVRSVVIDAGQHGNNAELTYVTGLKMYGPEKSLVVPLSAKDTPVQAAVAESLDEGYKITRGMKRAYERAGGFRVCADCGLTVPRYPGRYPSRCPSCGGQLEDLQNSPAYSESRRRKRRESNRDRRAASSQVRMVKRDRIPG